MDMQAHADTPDDKFAITRERARHKLEADLGPEFLTAFRDPETVELMLNPDGTLWQEKLGGTAMVPIGTIPPVRAESVIRTVAGYHRKVVTAEAPLLECKFPLDGSRFAGQIPPIVPGASFSLRKKALRIFALEQYVAAGILTGEHCEYLKRSIGEYRSILVSGGTGSGKTTLVNALIGEMVEQKPDERFVIMEDTAELQCKARNSVSMVAEPPMTLTMLLRHTLRMRPDRILVGEVRGAEALDLLDAWNTGHPGGSATLHANSPREALTRLVSMVSRNREAPKNIEPLIAAAADVIVQIERTNEGSRRIAAIIEIDGYRDGEWVFREI